ncbi:uncharacterized protein EI97DRAFT_427646 [Westerdykella ornata]|uniref:Uncharacterized protein n=1 Tax=Westerdykella ornata TaxID=318751 RepID=A0A6A6J5T3_WESOR|nr:uncharacterized protein EI97DRAFT_427646 [Westerdykella ornata]KAF2271752.1 hypothetical protein EI97DRAFT_427646 [Westerdykella ornata]
MSLAETYHVHLGFWTNWSYGKIEGATLTLTRRNGGLLVAFLAIFIGATGKSFWRIACFVLHRLLSNPTPQDGIYHQLQAILRNSAAAQDAAWSLGHVVWGWRVPARFRKPFPRLFAIITFAIVVSVSFGVAGIFSSQITTDTANEVLLKGDNCGPLEGNDVEDWDGYVNLFSPLQWKRVTTYANYALQCYYGNVTAGQEDCFPYLRPKLKTTVTTNASCPFDSEMCKSQTENLIVDTGFLDSHSDLGLNSVPEDRFQMRLVHHCAPIVTEGFSAPFKANDTDVETMRYYYGPLNSRANYTQEMPMLGSEFDIFNKSTYRPWRSRPRADYGINVLKTYSGTPYITDTFSMFTPIPQLNHTDADVMLFFLSSPGITFMEPVDDPWFSAHRQGPREGNVMHNRTRPTYLQDEPARVLGCTFRMQYCNPNIPEGDEGRCTPLAGYVDDRFDITSLYKDSQQKAKFRWAIDVFQLGFFSISGIVDSMGVSALVARQGLAANSQGPLPNNQWQREVQHWVGASLASIQGSFVEMANGPPGPQYERFRKAPENSTQETVCQNMKIITTKYSSFSVLGMGLILGFGTIIMFLDVALEPIVDAIHARRHRRGKGNAKATYVRLEWNANTTLQLQRLAHEHRGVGTWKMHGWAHPVTEPGEKLAMVDMRDEEHTLLVRPDEWEGLDVGKGEKGSPRISTMASGSSLWSDDSEDVRKAKATDPKVPRHMRRAMTFDSLDSSVSGSLAERKRRGVRRVDTGRTTLVDEENLGWGDKGGPISPDMLKKVKSFEGLSDGVRTPVEEEVDEIREGGKEGQGGGLRRVP